MRQDQYGEVQIEDRLPYYKHIDLPVEKQKEYYGSNKWQKVDSWPEIETSFFFRKEFT